MPLIVTRRSGLAVSDVGFGFHGDKDQLGDGPRVALIEEVIDGVLALAFAVVRGGPRTSERLAR